jgi:hypothetical protein
MRLVLSILANVDALPRYLLLDAALVLLRSCLAICYLFLVLRLVCVCARACTSASVLW